MPYKHQFLRGPKPCFIFPALRKSNSGTVRVPRAKTVGDSALCHNLRKKGTIVFIRRLSFLKMPARTTLSVLLIQLGLLCFAQSARNVRGVSRDEATSSLYTQSAPTENVTSTAPVESLPKEKANLITPKPRAFDPVRDFIKKNIASAGRNLTRNLLRARLSTSCIVGVAEFLRAFQELEPWALRSKLSWWL